MKRVVLDTNYLIAIISSRSEHFVVWKSLHEGKFVLFVDCAFAANASFIVSNDKHFSILSSIDFPRISVLRLEQFTRMMSRE